MDKRLDQFFTAARQISLTSEEKHLCREALLELDVADDTMPVFASATAFGMTSRERRQSRQTLELFMRQTSPQPVRQSVWSYIFHPHSKRLVAVVATIAIIVTGSGGVAYASEQALPGDTFYPVKVHVTEPLWERMQLRPEDQASWNRRRIERRMNEAERLARRGDFSPAIREELETRIAFHAERLEELLGSVESDTIPADIVTNMEADLAEHEAILTGLKDGSVTDDQLDSFLESVRQKHDMLRQKHPKGPPPEMQLMPPDGRRGMMPSPPTASGLGLQQRQGLRRQQFEEQRMR